MVEWFNTSDDDGLQKGLHVAICIPRHDLSQQEAKLSLQ